jgi:hypothetical protein
MCGAQGVGVYEQLYQGFDEDAAMAGSQQEAAKIPSLRPSLLAHPYRLRESQSEDFYSSVDLPIPLIEADKLIRYSIRLPHDTSAAVLTHTCVLSGVATGAARRSSACSSRW